MLNKSESSFHIFIFFFLEIKPFSKLHLRVYHESIRIGIPLAEYLIFENLYQCIYSEMVIISSSYQLIIIPLQCFLISTPHFLPCYTFFPKYKKPQNGKIRSYGQIQITLFNQSDLYLQIYKKLLWRIS